MRKSDWENEMPQVPESVHSAVLEALNSVGKTRGNAACDDEVRGEGARAGKNEVTYMAKNRKKKIAAIAVIAAAMLGTTAFAAERIWSSKMAEIFDYPSAEIQQKTVESGVAVLPEASAADQGVTVTVEQALQDENRINLVLRVDSQEPMIDGNSMFEGWKLHDGSGDAFGIFNNMSASFLTEDVGELKNTGYYIIDGLKDYENGWNGDKLYVDLSAFRYCTYENWDKATGEGEQTLHGVDGSWNLEIPLEDVSELGRTIRVDQNFECAGTDLTVNYVKLSPISALISYDAADIKQLEMQEEDFYPELLSLEVLDEAGNAMTKGYGGVSEWNTDDGQYMILMGMNTVIDMEQIEKIVLGGGAVTVEVQ